MNVHHHNVGRWIVDDDGLPSGLRVAPMPVAAHVRSVVIGFIALTAYTHRCWSRDARESALLLVEVHTNRVVDTTTHDIGGWNNHVDGIPHIHVVVSTGVIAIIRGERTGCCAASAAKNAVGPSSW